MTTQPGRTRIGRADWGREAYNALVGLGPQAVTVEGVARRLGVTKGSFYWHFAGREELLVAALEQWETRHTLAVIDAVDSAASPMDRLRALVTLVGQTPTEPGELVMYAAVPDPPVGPLAAAIHRVSHARIDYVAGLLRELGAPDAVARAELAVAMVIGQRTLSRAVPDLDRPVGGSADLVLTMLTAGLDLA